MKRALISCLALLLGLAESESVSATTYYVDPILGSDANSGLSETTAWKTSTKVGLASVSFQPGDVVKFRRGTVVLPNTTGTFVLQSSGTALGHILYTDYLKTGDSLSLPRPIIDSGNASIATYVIDGPISFVPYLGAAFNGLYLNRVFIPHAATINIGPGEMYWNSPMNTRYPYDNTKNIGLYIYGDVAGKRVAYAAASVGVNITNQSYMTFDNLEFAGGKHCIYGQANTAQIHHITVTNSVFRECQFSITILGSNFDTTDIVMMDNIVDHVGRGLYVGSQNENSTQRAIRLTVERNVGRVIAEARWKTFGFGVDQEFLSAQNVLDSVYRDNVLVDSPSAGCIVLWAHVDADMGRTSIIRNTCLNVANGVVFGGSSKVDASGRNVIAENTVLQCTGWGIKLNLGGSAISHARNNTVTGCLPVFVQTGSQNWAVYNRHEIFQ